MHLLKRFNVCAHKTREAICLKWLKQRCFFLRIRETFYDHIFDLLRFFVLSFWPRWNLLPFFLVAWSINFQLWNNYLVGVLKFHKGGKNLMTSFFTFQCSTICRDLNEKFTSHDCVSRRVAYLWSSLKHYCDNVGLNDGNYFRLSSRKSFESQIEATCNVVFLMQTLLSRCG